MATVVVRLPGSAVTSSTPTDAAVNASSVSSGGISDRARTSVVLPTPNPPATTIFSGTGPASSGTETVQQALQHRDGRTTVPAHRRRGVDHEEPGVGEVAHEHPGHPDRYA